MQTKAAKSLIPGQWVDYLGKRAQVLSVRPNGVKVGYYCAREIWRTARVSARYLETL